MPAFHRRSLTILALIFVLLLSSHLVAQRGRHGNQGAQGSTANPGAASDSDMQDFKRAVALQADPDQTTQFQAMIGSAIKALMRVQEFVDRPKNGDAAALTGQAGLFKLVMDDVNQRDQEFLSSFTNVQKSGHKKFIKELRRTESEANKQWKEFEKELQKTPIQDKDATDKAAILKDALLALQTEQKNIGTAMSIDLAKIPEQPAPQPVLTPR